MRKLSETQIQNEINKLEDQIKELEAKKYYLQTAIDYKEDVYDKADFVEDCNNKIKDRMLEIGLAGTHEVRIDLDLPEGLHKSKEFTSLALYIDEAQICRTACFIKNLPETIEDILLRDLELIMNIHDNGLTISELNYHDKTIRIYDGLFVHISHENFVPIGQAGEYSLKAYTKIANINDANEVESNSYDYRQYETRQIDFNMSKNYIGLNDVADITKQFIVAYKDALGCVDLKVKKRKELVDDEIKSEDTSIVVQITESSDSAEIKPIEVEPVKTVEIDCLASRELNK